MSSINKYSAITNAKKMRRTVFNYFQILAKKILDCDDNRTFFIASCALRTDGKMVFSQNSLNKQPNPVGHSEHKLCKKLTRGAVVYVVRISRNGSFALSKPCQSCENILRLRGVKKVIYSISNNSYGILDL
jgi:hypothetical protein